MFGYNIENWICPSCGERLSSGVMGYGWAIERVSQRTAWELDSFGEPYENEVIESDFVETDDSGVEEWEAIDCGCYIDIHDIKPAGGTIDWIQRHGYPVTRGDLPESQCWITADANGIFRFWLKPPIYNAVEGKWHCNEPDAVGEMIHPAQPPVMINPAEAADSIRLVPAKNALPYTKRAAGKVRSVSVFENTREWWSGENVEAYDWVAEKEGLTATPATPPAPSVKF